MNVSTRGGRRGRAGLGLTVRVMASARRHAIAALAIVGTATWADHDPTDEALAEPFGSEADALMAFGYLAAYAIQALANERAEPVATTIVHLRTLLVDGT